MAKLVKEHYLNPEQFLNTFYSTLDSLYSPPPHHPKRSTLDVFKTTIKEHSTPALPRPSTAFFENKNPSLEDTILLRQLLNDRELEILILIYCQAGSPLFTLYRAYQANQQLKNIRAFEQNIFEQETDLLNTCYQLGMFQFLQELHHLPTRYLKSVKEFCLTCYHVGHYQTHCQHYQCFSCLRWQPGHRALACPCNYRPSSLPRRHFYKRKTSSSSDSSTKPLPIIPRATKKLKKGSFKSKQKQPEELLEELIESIQRGQAFELDDDAVANITGRPSGPF